MSLTPDQKKDILDLFCQSTHVEIVGPGKARLLRIMKAADRDALIKNNEYNAYFNGLDELLLDVESVSSASGPGLQVKKALDLLSRGKGELNREFFAALVTLVHRKLLPQWAPPYKEIYVTGEDMILGWTDLFISYTNGTAPAVNNSYKAMLVYELKEAHFQRHKEDFNLMGNLIYDYFSLQRLRAFYDKEKIYVGNRFQEKLDLYASRSFVFAQLVEMKMFLDDPCDNYCYQEFHTYKTAIESFSRDHQLPAIHPLFVFLVSNPAKVDKYKFVPAGLKDKQLLQWAKEIGATQYITIYSDLPNELLKIEIQKAATEIVDYSDNFLQNFLDSIPLS